MWLVFFFISSTNQWGLGADGNRVKTRGPCADTGSCWRSEGRGGARFGSASGRWLSGLSLRYLQLPFRTMHRNPPPPWGGTRLLQPPYIFLEFAVDLKQRSKQVFGPYAELSTSCNVALDRVSQLKFDLVTKFGLLDNRFHGLISDIWSNLHSHLNKWFDVRMSLINIVVKLFENSSRKQFSFALFYNQTIVWLTAHTLYGKIKTIFSDYL